MKKKIAFIAGPYRADSIDGIYENIQRARQVAKKYWRTGDYAAVICPHLNTMLMDGFMSDRVWLDGAMALLDLADTIVMMKGYSASSGACAEEKRAEMTDKEIIYD